MIRFRFAIITFLFFALGAQSYLFAQAMNPPIYSITHNGVGTTFSPGDTLTVMLRGASGGTATFDVTAVTTGVPMQEVSPGNYVGHFTIPAGRQIPFASVAGHLSLNGSQSSLVAKHSVAIWDYTTPVAQRPEVSPPPGAATTSLRPLVSVYFLNPIRVNSVDLTADGTEYANQIQITPNSVNWTPAYNLSPGSHHVVISAMDTSGQRVLREWNFYVIGFTGSNIIQSVSHMPNHVTSGQTVTVVMLGTSGGAATMTVGRGGPIAMTEGQPGVYAGSYTVPAGYQGPYADLTVQLQLPDGRQGSLTDTNALLVQATPPGSFFLSLDNPYQNSMVHSRFDVTGETVPGFKVNISAWGKDGQPIASTQVIANREGNFDAQINLKNAVPPGTRLTVVAQAQDDQGDVSDESRFDVYYRQ